MALYTQQLAVRKIYNRVEHILFFLSSSLYGRLIYTMS